MSEVFKIVECRNKTRAKHVLLATEVCKVHVHTRTCVGFLQRCWCIGCTRTCVTWGSGSHDTTRTFAACDNSVHNTQTCVTFNRGVLDTRTCVACDSSVLDTLTHWVLIIMEKKNLDTRCPSFNRTLWNPYSSWLNEWNFTKFHAGQDKICTFFIWNLQICSFKIACFIRYLVKADINEKSSKAKRLHTLTIPWK